MKITKKQIVWGSLLVGIGLRLFYLGGRSLWLDESFSVTAAEMSLDSIWGAVLEQDHPPLYYTLLHFWLMVGKSEFWIRLLGVFAAVGSLVGAYLFGERFVAKGVGVWAVALLAMAPLDIWYAQEARAYIFIPLCGLIFLFGVWRRDLVGIVVAGLGFGIGLYFDYVMIPWWVGISAVVFVIAWHEKGGFDRLLVRNWGFASWVGWMIYLPWWQEMNLFLEERLGVVFIFAQLQERLGLAQLSGAVYVGVLALIFLLLLAGLTAGWWLWQKEGVATKGTYLLLVGFGLVTLLLPWPRLYGIKRVLVTGWPLIVLAVGWLLMQLDVKQRERIGYGLLLISLLASLGQVGVKKEDWRGAVRYLESEKGAAETVWVEPHWNGYPYNFYATEDVVIQRDKKEIEQLGEEVTGVWLIVEREGGLAVERWLDQNWQMVEERPFYHLLVKHYER